MKLYLKAKEAMANAYAPYSDFKVGAAVLTAAGDIFTGANVESASYGATLCAERAAISAAIAAGVREFSAIAVAASGTEPAYPCGICRQVIFEFGPDIRVIVGADPDHLEAYTIAELLPHGFRL